MWWPITDGCLEKWIKSNCAKIALLCIFSRIILEFQSFVFAASFNFWVNPAWLSQHPDRNARSAPISSITGKTCPYPRDRNASCVNRNYTSTCRGSPTISCINAKTPRLIKRGWACVLRMHELSIYQDHKKKNGGESPKLVYPQAHLIDLGQ